LIFEEWVEEEESEVVPDEPIQTGDVVPWINELNRQGKVTIFFTEKINPWSDSTLAKYSSEEEKNELLVVKVIQAPESDISADNLTFTWEILDVTDEYMEIQLRFDATEYVSAILTDKLSVVFLRGSEFLAGNSTENTTVSDMKEIQVNIKKQMPLSAFVEVFMDVSDATATSSMATAVGAGVLNILLQTSFQMLWSLINTFQIIVHLQLINVNTPANALSLLEEI